MSLIHKYSLIKFIFNQKSLKKLSTLLPIESLNKIFIELTLLKVKFSPIYRGLFLNLW